MNPEHADDLRLVRAALRGDTLAREELAERMRITSRILAARNARMGRPLGDAELEDLAQDTVLTVWSKLGTYEGRASLETWVYRFCYLELMNALRRKARAPASLEDLSILAPLVPGPINPVKVRRAELVVTSALSKDTFSLIPVGSAWMTAVSAGLQFPGIERRYTLRAWEQPGAASNDPDWEYSQAFTLN